MTCPVCGTPTVPAARFCFACGAQLASVGHVPPDVETDRRVVTVLFGDLSDFTSWAEDLDPERVGVVTDRVLASLAAIVGDFGGHVDKLTGDGIMAVFGAPTAHEDDAERAVRAAARMQAVVRRLVEQESGGGQRLGLRVGLNTGEVVAGVQAHLSYTVIGDAVNTAARLSDAAGVGAVYAGRDTALSTLATASWRALAAAAAQGQARAGPGVRAGRAAAAGREPARARRRRAVPRPRRRARAAGRPGARRRRPAGLAHGAHHRRRRRRQDPARPGAGPVLRRAARGPRAVGPLRAVRRGARPRRGRRRWCGRRAASARATTSRRPASGCAARSPGWSTRRTPVRCRARSATGCRRCSGSPTSAPSPRASRRPPGAPVGGDSVRQAVAALFSALAADSLLVLVVDDLHWATPTMLEGLLDVSRQVRGQVLLLAVGRPEVLERLPARGDDQAWWSPLPSAELLPLLPLEESAAERLLRAYLGAGAGGSVRTRPRGPRRPADPGAGQPVLPRRAAAPARRPRRAASATATAGG